MMIVRSLTVNNVMTFSDFAEALWERVNSIANKHSAKRLDFVVDDYRKNTIKEGERSARAKTGMQRIKIGNPNQNLQKQWKKYLAHSDNKQELLKFLFDYFSSNKRLYGIEVYITYKNQCRTLSSNSDVPALKCSHE